MFEVTNLVFESNGMKLHYERVGEGKPVLVLHGWGASIDAVRPIANCIQSLGMEAISIDFPGFGKTDEPNFAWGVPEYADLIKTFIEAIGIVGCDVVAHSFGGRVTVLLASNYPNLFSKIVLVDAAGVRPKRGLKYYSKVYAYKIIKRLAKIVFVNKLFGLSTKTKSAGSEDYRALKTDVMRDTFKKVVNLDLTYCLPKITNETLLIWGSEDKATPLYMAKTMEKQIKNSGLVIFEGAGHFSYAERYSQFCAVMKSFFAR